MSSNEIHIVGVLRPKPGKIDRFIELISKIAERIHTHEKDITRFQVSREVGKDTFILIETYESQATVDRHFAAPEYAQFQATLKSENIIDFKDPADAEIRIVKHCRFHVELAVERFRF